jgi:hypothetical protein
MREMFLAAASGGIHALSYVGAAASGVSHAVRHVGFVLAAPPDPGQGTPPPGSEKLLLLLKWVAWAVFGCCVAGVLIVAGRMALMHRRGEGGEHAAGLGWVALACILAGSASSIVGLLI